MKSVLAGPRFLTAPTGHRLREPVEVQYSDDDEMISAYASAWWMQTGCQMDIGRGSTRQEAHDDLVNRFVDQADQTVHWKCPAVLFEPSRPWP